MKGFGIEIKNNLLDPKHVDNMGPAVWLYMWMIDKMTSINEDGIGLVLGGKPVKYEEVAEELGGEIMSLRTYRRWVKILREHDYINTVKSPHGLSFSVNKAYKKFGHSYAKNGTTQPLSSATNGTSVVPEMAHREDKNGTTPSIHNAVDNNSKTGIEFEKFWKVYPKKVDKKKSEQKWNNLPKSTQELILVDLTKRTKSDQWLKNGGQFIPNPTTYINGERWNDQIISAPPISSGQTGENWTQKRLLDEAQRQQHPDISTPPASPERVAAMRQQMKTIGQKI